MNAFTRRSALLLSLDLYNRASIVFQIAKYPGTSGHPETSKPSNSSAQLCGAGNGIHSRAFLRHLR